LKFYFFKGTKSSPDEKGSSAIIAAQIDDELGGSAVQVKKSLVNAHAPKILLVGR